MRQKKAAAFTVPPVVLIDHSRLNLAPYNPNVMTAEERESLRASIVKYGLVENFVVQKYSMKFKLELVLIGGHQRLGEVRAIRAEEGIHEPLKVPCVVVDISDDDAMQLNIALNNIGGTPDPFKLGEIFAQVLPQMTSNDVLATGFTAEQASELVRLTLPPPPPGNDEEIGDFGKSVTLSVDFGSVKERDTAKQLLKDLAKERNKRPGLVVLELLKTTGKSSRRGRPRATE